MISAALAVLENEGQREELSVFYEKYKNRFLNIALNKLNDKDAAEDAVQEAFLEIANKPDNFFSLNDEDQIFYVCAIVKNVSVDMYNKKGHIQTEELTENIIYQSNPELLESLVLDEFSYNELIEFIRGLPKLQLNVLILNRLLKLSISETAQQLNISETAVNQRLYLARKAIKQFVEERRNRND